MKRARSAGRSAVQGLSSVVAAVVLSVGPASAGAPDPGETEAYEAFREFCIAHFGAEKEPLAYDKFGRELRILEDGIWVYPSETSCSIGWDTSLPARSYVEYGLTSAYGSRTPDPERHFYVNLRHLTGLRPDTPYHFRLVAVDERGNRVATADMTFTTRATGGSVQVPGEPAGPPYVLDQPGTTYVLTRDITAPHTAFKIAARDVTLDLNGHTVVYNDERIDTQGWKSFGTYIEKSAFGVFLDRQGSPKVFNGTIRQGRGDNGACAGPSIGFSPFHGEHTSGKIELAGVRFIYGSDQMNAVKFHWSGGEVHVHHCEFRDMGHKLRNRHGGGCRALGLDSGQKASRVHHNLVTRTRQSGLSGKTVFRNEVYVDSWAINSFAISVHSEGGEGYGNRIFGTGFNAYGLHGGTKDWTVHDNFVHLEGYDVQKRWGERWGDINMLAGCRLTNYGKGGKKRENLVYHDNVIVLRGKEDCELRGVEFMSDSTVKGFVFRNNIVKAEALDEQTTRVACVDAQGQYQKADTIPLVYRDNTFISNRHIVRFGDAYAKGNNHHFINCRLVKSGDHPYFSTFLFGGAYWNYGHIVRDCAFEGGTAHDDVRWGRTGSKSAYRVEHTLTVKGPADVTVRIADKTGRPVFEGAVGADGMLGVPLALAEYRPPANHNWKAYEEGRDGMPGASVTALTPHTVNVLRNGASQRAEVSMDRPRQLDLATLGSEFSPSEAWPANGRE
ncbi:MAG: fibronectin type III domain-containing protein [Kiritimatiellae bacterium]|nr:fibronectin type III domain-containing protein [Kiritimatiellia bacterium]